MCLPEVPEYDETYKHVTSDFRAWVYSAEYQVHDFSPYAGKHDHDVPCAVCRTTNRGSVMMIPAKMNCPAGWTKEYNGFLMAEYWKHHSSEFVCVDRNPEIRAGSITNKDGALFYPAAGSCGYGNLPCKPYKEGVELTCVVCSK